MKTDKFDLSDISEIKKSYSEIETNRLLKDGYKLLYVGEYAEPPRVVVDVVYVLGKI